MSYQAQGVESEFEYGMGKNIFVRAGYTYLDAVVQHSFSSDTVGPSFNPNYPEIPIDNYAPLVGARPFRRPPHTGFASVTYTGKQWSGVVQAAYASRSDDSTISAATTSASATRCSCPIAISTMHTRKST